MNDTHVITNIYMKDTWPNCIHWIKAVYSNVAKNVAI